MFISKNNGFSLIELIIVLIITAIMAQLGFVSFNRYNKKIRAFAAKTALKNIQKECEINRNIETNLEFTQVNLDSYEIETRNNNSCLGKEQNDLVIARPTKDNYPFYFYNFKDSLLGCEVNERELNSGINNEKNLEGNRTTFRLDGWWGRNDGATITINGIDFKAKVSDYHLGVRNDDLDEKPASWGYSWDENFWEQISKEVNNSKLIDNEGNPIKAEVLNKQLSISSKSQIPLEIKIVAYNDQGGSNTRPRFNKQKVIVPPKQECSNFYDF